MRYANLGVSIFRGYEQPRGFHLSSRLIRWTFPQFIEREITYPEPFASYGTSAVTRTSGRGHVAEA